MNDFWRFMGGITVLIVILLFGARMLHATPMVDMIFHEARDQPKTGQQLVYRTVKNRAADTRWKADTDRKVIYQYKQFSFTLLPAVELLRRSLSEYDSYQQIESNVSQWAQNDLQDLKGYEGVNHYMRCDITDRVKWDDNMKFLGAVGDHCFFKGY